MIGAVTLQTLREMESGIPQLLSEVKADDNVVEEITTMFNELLDMVNRVCKENIAFSLREEEYIEVLRKKNLLIGELQRKVAKKLTK